MTQQPSFCIRGRNEFLHLDLVGYHRQVQFLEDILYSLNELGTLLDEVVGAAALGREDATGDREDFAVLIGGPARSNDRAALQVTFDYENAEAHAGHDAIAAGGRVSSRAGGARGVGDGRGGLRGLPGGVWVRRGGGHRLGARAGWQASGARPA